jgi:hypothetical protein
MNPEVKRKWIEALKSGEYEQGHHSLKTKEGDRVTYCCLGVLCDLYGKEHGNRWGKRRNQYPTFMKEMSALPKKVMEWAGIDTSTGEIRYKNGNRTALIRLNDNGKSFKQIAKVIEKYF